jgi:hypothetical protein
VTSQGNYGGLPALPGLSIAFLAAHADLLLRQWRSPPKQDREGRRSRCDRAPAPC